MCHQKIDVRLPSPGQLGSDFTPVPMPLLRDACQNLNECSPKLSSYAACVLIVDLVIRCFEHIGLSNSRGFWDSHYALLKTIGDRSSTLKSQLGTSSVREDPVAFTVHMNICAIEILFREAAISQVQRQGLPGALAAENQRLAVAAAYKISSAVRLTWPDEETGSAVFLLQSTFINWPIATAMRPLCRELATLNPRHAASSGVAHSLRLLLSALDRSEGPHGFWHTSTASIAAKLREWEQKIEFDAIGS